MSNKFQARFVCSHDQTIKYCVFTIVLGMLKERGLEGKETVY